MFLDVSLARTVVRERIAEPLGLSLEEASEGIIRVVNANMLRGIRRVSVERGHDPRNFSMLCFGGGGPLHATELAMGLTIPTVIIPISPGVNSAVGLLVADFRYDYSKTYLEKVSALKAEELNRHYRDLEEQALQQMLNEKIAREQVIFLRSADMRYYGQGYEIEVPVPGKKLEAEHLEDIKRAFNESHERLYG